MSLTLLEVCNLRIVRHTVLEPSPGLNILVGPNGSGKSSLLEAVHMLGMGRSFRTGLAAYPVRHGEKSLTVHGRWRTERGDEVLLGVERGHEHRRIRVNGSTCAGASVLAQVLPLQAVLPDSRYLFLHSAKFRRGVLDWGLFHVEPRFYELWVRYQRALRQRNAGLRVGAGPGRLAPWEQALADKGEQIEQLRARYMEQWRQCACEYAALLLPGLDLSISAQRGWPAGIALADALRRDRERDRVDGYTHAGAHRADLQVLLGGAPLRDCASQGQQILVVLALRLAQLELFMRETGRRCLLMLDDVLNQLDSERRLGLLARVAELGAQTFVTTTDAGALKLTGSGAPRLFHVEQGQVKAQGKS
jgi:DNA replication and repair protein RecF